MSNNKLISVLIPYYNDEAYLREAVESVLTQTYTNFELILINHASIDSSREIAHSFDDDRIVHFDMPRNEGASGGFIFPKFMELSKGEYLKPFCADDVMLKDCLQLFVDYVNENKDTDIVFSDAQYINKKGAKINATWFTNRKNFNINDTPNEMLIKYKKGVSFLPYISSLIKKNSFCDIEINNNYVLFFDMSLWAQSLIKGKKIKLYDEITTLYRIHDDQISGTKSSRSYVLGASNECFVFNNYFYEIDNIETVKELCPENKYAQMLEVGDERFISFVLAVDFLNGKTYEQKMSGYYKISGYFRDEQMRNELWEKFGFGVKEFRGLYIIPQKKMKIKDKPSRTLNLFELTFLLFRCIFKIVTFSSLRKKLKKDRQYTI